MLQLKNIVKHYTAGDSKVEALKGVSISFRKNELEQESLEERDEK